MGKHHSVIARIVENPYIQLIVGLILLATVLFDNVLFDIQHSVALLALWHVAQALPNILQSLERIDKIETDKEGTQ